MGLTFNDIRRRAIEFSVKWESATRERADSKSFWDDFFLIWGVSRLRVATFEAPVKKLGGKQGFIDLFWKGTLLVEHKSKGEDLDSAYDQALSYFPGLTDEELPKFVLVSDFARFRLYDLAEGTDFEFPLKDLYKHTDRFGFILGWKKQRIVEDDPVNFRAVELMGRLHDSLKESGFGGHELEVFLVRLMFCVFADSTGIFNPKGHFTYYLEQKTQADGSDLGSRLADIFQELDKPMESRQSTLNADLASFPYVDGLLFSERLPFPNFDRTMRELLLKCCHFDWSTVSPAIFGSLFQSVMDPERRRDLGGHYTSERNILKVLRPLFLDELRAELGRCGKNERKLRELFSRIGRLRFLDPACGCGNFLAITYRELRLIELEIRKRLRDISEDPRQQVLDIELGRALDVDAFHGVEIEEFPAQIARVALWLVDHQMNIQTSLELGRYEVRLPLKTAPSIRIGNALRIDWNDLIPASEVSFVFGNPPYAGKKRRNPSQVEDMDLTFEGKVRGYGVLDYVTCWYVKALEYVKGTSARVAFVSTNAITHGEQVSILWSYLLREGARIQFAHRTFAWTSDVKGAAAVSVVVIGFGTNEVQAKRLFDYSDPKGEPTEITARNINPYLIDQPTVLLPSRETPICPVPEIVFGSMPNDGGHLVFTDDEKVSFIQSSPESKPFFRPLLSAKEYLNGERRWCLWLSGVSPQDFRRVKAVMERVELVRAYRAGSKRPTTRTLASSPYLFGEVRQPLRGDFILIPRVSSENRRYIPIGFFDSRFIVSDTCLFVPGGSLYHFGVLTSAMHMAWVRQVAGRLTERLRYSNKIVYNNFPWPDSPSSRQVREVERRAKDVLEARRAEPNASFADLYSPLTMPRPLLQAHERLDAAVDRCYRSAPFKGDLARLRVLFALYLRYDPVSKTLDAYEFPDEEGEVASEG